MLFVSSLRRIFEGGLLEKWKHNNAADFVVSNNMFGTRKVIQMGDIYGAACVLAGGICCGLMVLSLELVKKKYQK